MLGMTPWRQRYLDRYYDRNAGFVDGTTEFHRLCGSVCPPRSDAQILEVGAGPSNETSRLLATLGDVHGLDPDPAVRTNDALASASVLTGSEYPFESHRFDACVSNYVLEHVSDPRQHLSEVNRILKPGAPYVFRTPNRRHYAYLASSVMPHSVHVLLANRLRQLPGDAHEPYPTVYAFNSRKQVQTMSTACGFSVETLRLIEKEPSYGMASRVLFFPFMFYERLVNSTARLEGARSTILAVLRRPGQPSAVPA